MTGLRQTMLFGTQKSRRSVRGHNRMTETKLDF